MEPPDIIKIPNVFFPKLFCPKHPKLLLSSYCESPEFKLLCSECIQNSNSGKSDIVEFKDLFKSVEDSLGFIANHLNQSSKNLFSIEKEQISLISTFKQKFIEIFEQYEKDAADFFLKLQNNLRNKIDFELIQKKILLFNEYKDPFGDIKFLKSLEVSAMTLPQQTEIVLQELKDFSNELAFFLTDSLETLKKSYLKFSRVCSEQIAEKSRNSRKKSLLLKAPDRIFEINGSTPFAKDITLLRSNKDSFTFCTCSNDEKLRIWQFREKTQDYSLISTLSEHSDWINRLVYEEERNLLFSSSRDSTIKVWSLDTFKCVKSLSGHSDSVFGLSTFRNDSPILASGSYDKTVKLWDFETEELKTSVTLESSVYEIRAYSLDKIGLFLVAGDSLGTLSFFHVENGIELKKRAKIKAHDGCVLRLCYMEREKSLVSSANKDKFIKIWNAMTLSLVHKLSLHDERGVSGLFYEEKEEVLFTAGKDNSIKMLRTRDMEVMEEWKDSFIQFGGIAWEQNRRVLLTCGGKKIGSAVQMTINLRFFK